MLEQLQLSGGSTLSAETVLAIVQGPSERDIVYSGLVSHICVLGCGIVLRPSQCINRVFSEIMVVDNC